MCIPCFRILVADDDEVVVVVYDAAFRIFFGALDVFEEAVARVPFAGTGSGSGDAFIGVLRRGCRLGLLRM